MIRKERLVNQSNNTEEENIIVESKFLWYVPINITKVENLISSNNYQGAYGLGKVLANKVLDESSNNDKLLEKTKEGVSLLRRIMKKLGHHIANPLEK